jgi:hypothetical protein
MPHKAQWLSVWALVCGLSLWFPAVAMPFAPLPLQALDLVVLCGLPLVASYWARFGKSAGWIGLSFLASVGLSFSVAGGEWLILVHALCLALPFVAIVSLCGDDAAARGMLLRGFLIGGVVSALFFLAQIVFGAEALDFRTNVTFSLPSHYRRGFAFFPEVSTFATHATITLAICLALVLHPVTARRDRKRALWLAILMTLALMLSRSTSFLVVAPILCLFAATQARRMTIAWLLRLGLMLGLIALLLAVFFTQFYVDRLDTAAAPRSIAMRLASILGGLSPLWTGELFGVGLGENHEILRRSFDIGRTLDLNFGQLPQGVNSQIVARIFEEGWPAALNLGLGLALLLRVSIRHKADPVVAALTVLALGSFLTALMVTGYRGIYTNWLWLGLPAGLLAAQQRKLPTNVATDGHWRAAT